MTDEPQTTSTLLFETNYGPISIDLWATEAPAACRLLVQQCIDGFYDNTPFERVVKGCMVYLRRSPPTQVETHPKLRFNRRGMVGVQDG